MSFSLFYSSDSCDNNVIITRQAFYNWAIAISDRAKMRGRTKEAEELWKQVRMKFQYLCLPCKIVDFHFSMSKKKMILPL